MDLSPELHISGFKFKYETETIVGMEGVTLAAYDRTGKKIVVGVTDRILFLKDPNTSPELISLSSPPEVQELQDRIATLESDLKRVCNYYNEMETADGLGELINHVERHIMVTCRACSKASGSHVPVRHYLPECPPLEET